MARFSTNRALHKEDPRISEIDRIIEDEYAAVKDKYGTSPPCKSNTKPANNARAEAPKNPIILAHGLLGFDELRIAGTVLPGIHYWRGITEALAAKGVEVITATVPASGSIEMRAKKLGEDIEAKAKGKSVNIIAYASIRNLR
ncbi:lipase 2 [Elasticomyces elasticus]|nr:lipase 2 [Elasticomyces elasticus]